MRIHLSQKSTARQHSKTAQQDSTARQHSKTAQQGSLQRQASSAPTRHIARGAASIGSSASAGNADASPWLASCRKARKGFSSYGLRGVTVTRWSTSGASER